MKGRAKFWGEQIVVSKKQVDFAHGIIDYRKTHNLSQKEMARICSLYGKTHGVKFAQTEISAYECLKKAPRKIKFEVLTNVIG